MIKILVQNLLKLLLWRLYVDKCTTCGNEIKLNCDWQQGRCPHRTPMISTKIIQTRIQNLLDFFKGNKK